MIHILFIEIKRHGNLSGLKGLYGMSISDIKDIVNILFFIIIATITILSYTQAKKSLFSPIRTETFKMQLQAFEKILLYFQNNSESDFDEKFDLKNILQLNNLKMLDEYIGIFFGELGDENARKEIFGQFVGGVVSEEKLNKFFLHVPTKNSEIIQENPLNNKNNWQEYNYIFVQFTKKYTDEMRELQNLSASPLLPESVRIALNDFEKSVRLNLQLVEEVVQEFARGLPIESPKIQDISDININGIWNVYNHKKINMENKAQVVLDSISTYLNIENLLKS